MDRSRIFNILLVEDDPAAAKFLRTVCLQPRPRRRLFHVADGEQALAFLRRTQPYERARRPDLILLDLNLPRVNGLDVLASIKADIDLRSIPCVVLSASEYPTDVREAYAIGAACYITKPVDLAQYERALTSSLRMWLEIASLASARPLAASAKV